MFSLVAARPSPPSAAGHRLRAAGGPHRFAALWPDLRARLQDAHRSAALHPVDRPEALPQVFACGGDA